eukprot:gene20369-24448_t
MASVDQYDAPSPVRVEGDGALAIDVVRRDLFPGELTGPHYFPTVYRLHRDAVTFGFVPSFDAASAGRYWQHYHATRQTAPAAAVLPELLASLLAAQSGKQPICGELDAIARELQGGGAPQGPGARALMLDWLRKLPAAGYPAFDGTASRRHRPAPPPSFPVFPDGLRSAQSRVCAIARPSIPALHAEKQDKNANYFSIENINKHNNNFSSVITFELAQKFNFDIVFARKLPMKHGPSIAGACMLGAAVLSGMLSLAPLPAHAKSVARADVLDNCNWNRPGVDPFMGDVVAAVDRYTDIAPPVREQLKERMRARQYDEIVVISRDAIRGKGNYNARISDMHFGPGRVCRNVTRSGWSDQMQERGLVYCVQGQCILVPTICRNVSRI